MFVQRSKQSALQWNIVIDQVPDPDNYLEEGDVLTLGNLELKVLHTPGHSPGGISIYIESENVVFSGDTLFQGSIGRTDFDGGSMTVLARSIREKLYTLPDETIVYSGHGPPTTIGEEKMHNMFVR
jgi:glyoxylase-like metal-dependent hydrolase (beta-lactamase superfamily II)